MLCKIAELITEVPAAGGLASRCRDYLCKEERGADITIRTDLYRSDRYDARYSEQIIAEMESGFQFYNELLRFGGLYLHASAVVLDGKAYLFSGNCGAGKSTHTRLWQQTFGSGAVVINDDKPALRRIDGQWIVYGTPWCGKAGIHCNLSAPLAGICYLKKAQHNAICRLSEREALQRILAQTIRKFQSVERLDMLMDLLGDLLIKIPVYELENLPEPDAARLSYKTMLCGAMEEGL